MRRLLVSASLVLMSLSQAPGQTSQPVVPEDANALVQKIQAAVLAPAKPPEAEPDPNVPHGEYLGGTVMNPSMYPGTQNDFQVYVPAQYDPAKPACLLIKLDGLGSYEGTVLDNLIAKKEVPVIIAVGVSPGAVWLAPSGTPDRPARFNRSFEFDSMHDRFPQYVLNDLLPAVQKLKTHDGRAINISTDGNDHAAMGMSSGGIGSFTLAWLRPDQFSRVFCSIGTFVPMRGGNEYQALVRKTEPKPLRVFLEDGSEDSWNPLFGSWYAANLSMESALTFAGYDVAHAWGTHGHDGGVGDMVMPDVMRWLWRDYPGRIKPGSSQNSTLQEIVAPGAGWEKLPQTFQSAAGLAANSKGEVYLSDAPAGAVYRLGTDGKAAPFLEQGPGIVGEAFGPDDTLYGAVPGQKKIIAMEAHGGSRIVSEGIAAHGIVVTHDGTVYATEPGEHSDMPSTIWQIKPAGEKKALDQGLSAATGLAFLPDGQLFLAAESTSKWIYSYVVQPDGTLADKQPVYWLHMTDLPSNAGTEDLAFDAHGNLYAATRLGVQVADRNGRVRAILPLPTPCAGVRSLCFGGPAFDTLYVTDGTQVWTRKLKVPGVPPWSAPITLPPHDQS